MIELTTPNTQQSKLCIGGYFYISGGIAFLLSLPLLERSLTFFTLKVSANRGIKTSGNRLYLFIRWDVLYILVFKVQFGKSSIIWRLHYYTNICSLCQIYFYIESGVVRASTAFVAQSVSHSVAQCYLVRENSLKPFKTHHILFFSVFGGRYVPSGSVTLAKSNAKALSTSNLRFLIKSATWPQVRFCALRGGKLPVVVAGLCPTVCGWPPSAQCPLKQATARLP